MDTRFAGAVWDIRNHRYGRLVAHPGWVYAAQIDHRFLDGRLRPTAIQRHAPRYRDRPEAADPEQAAAEHLSRLGQLSDPASLLAALDDLTGLETPALTVDSFSGRSEPEGREAVSHPFSGGRLNVIIVGAGPVGLALASAVKVALGAHVDVLLLEDRVSSPHRKLPYQRRWITAVAHATIDGLFDDTVSRILKTIGDETCIGAPINILESLLLLSCRRMGVRLLFTEGFDLSTIRDLPVHMVFDASGNRFRPLSSPSSPEEIAIVDWVGADRLVLDVQAMNGFGVQIRPPVYDRYVIVGCHQGLFIPTCDGHVIKQAMMKVIRIPARLGGALLDHIHKHNADNKFYAWTGHLHASINEVLLLINLERAEFEHLCENYAFPLSLADAVELGGLRASLDERTGAILELLARLASDAEREQMGIDAPFLYRPYLVDVPGGEELHGKPLLRIGDSVYNGNVKIANGLSSHLQHVRHIQETLWRSMATLSAERAGRSMKVVRQVSVLSDP